MLSQEAVQHLAKSYGKTEAEVSAAITATDSQSLGELQVEVFTSDEKSKLTENIRGAGIEIGIKNAAKAAGLTLGAEKTPEALVSAMKSEFGGSNDAALTKEIEELKKKLANNPDASQLAAVQEKYDTLKTTYETEVSGYKEKEEQAKKRQEQQDLANFIATTLPKKGAILPNEDLILLGRNKFDLFKGEDGVYYQRDEQGNTVRDKVGEPRKAAEILTSHYEDNYTKKEGGNAGGSGSGVSPKGMSSEDAQKWIAENTDLNLTSREGLAKFNELTSGEEK